MVAVKKRVSIETEFLREFAREVGNEVAFTPEAEDQMRKQMVTLACVHQVMRAGAVESSDKFDAESSAWVVVGQTCNDDTLWLTLEVVYDHYRMTILEVIKR